MSNTSPLMIIRQYVSLCISDYIFPALTHVIQTSPHHYKSWRKNAHRILHRSHSSTDGGGCRCRIATLHNQGPQCLSSAGKCHVVFSCVFKVYSGLPRLDTGFEVALKPCSRFLFKITHVGCFVGSSIDIVGSNHICRIEHNSYNNSEVS